ncbi:hypothetical protein [Streptomyces sp. NPDC046939]|uniref:hypothetical protein n=1 Tax=Streptomyces sp. NPDC046939 TaxID=3155376 RepID=UPI0033D3EF5D
MTTPSKPARKWPKILSVRRNAKINRALSIISATGMNTTEATEWALNMAANCLALAWENGHEKPGVMPDMRVSYRVKDPV